MLCVCGMFVRLTKLKPFFSCDGDGLARNFAGISRRLRDSRTQSKGEGGEGPGELTSSFVAAGKEAGETGDAREAQATGMSPAAKNGGARHP